MTCENFLVSGEGLTKCSYQEKRIESDLDLGLFFSLLKNEGELEQGV